MGNDQSYVYADRMMVKLIESPIGVRLKLCPEVGDGEGTPEWDEVEGAMEVELDRGEINYLIDALRKHRNRVFGKDV